MCLYPIIGERKLYCVACKFGVNWYGRKSGITTISDRHFNATVFLQSKRMRVTDCGVGCTKTHLFSEAVVQIFYPFYRVADSMFERIYAMLIPANVKQSVRVISKLWYLRKAGKVWVVYITDHIGAHVPQQNISRT